MITKLQQLNCKTKVKFYYNTNNFYDEMKNRRQSGNFRFEEDPLSKDVRGIGKFYHEVILLMKFLETKPQVKNVNNIYNELYYIVIKNRDDKENVNDDEYELITLFLRIS